MPRTLIPTDKSNDAGIENLIDTAADSVNGMEFFNSGEELLFVKNAHTGPVTVTLNYAPDNYGRAGTKQVSVPNGKTFVIGPFIPPLYNQSNKVQVDFSVATNINVAVVAI